MNKAIMKRTLEEIYLDYFNNFLTISAFSQYWGITDEQGEKLINILRDIREE